MKIEDIRSLSIEMLKEKLYSLQEKLFTDFRYKKAIGRLEHSEQIRKIRKDIARVSTVLRERELAANKKVK